jgi:tight adherence protein C
MPETALLISILVFAGIMFLGSGIFYYYNSRKNQRELIEKIKGGTAELNSGVNSADQTQKADGTGSVKEYFLRIVDLLSSFIKPKSEQDIYKMRKGLMRAGYRKSNAMMIFYGMKVLLAILLPVGLLFFKVFITKAIPVVNFMTFSIVMALIGYFLPNYWLILVTEQRKRKILEGFPDALDLMVVCMEAGMGLDAAIFRAGREIELKNKVISEEFKLLSLELRAGKTRRDALSNLAMRIDLEDVNSLISLLIQTDRFGTSIAQALRVNSDSMRVKRHQMAEEIAAKLPVKLVFPLILFIFPSLFVVLLGPAAIKIYRNLFPYLGGQ